MDYSKWFDTNLEGKQKVEGERADFSGPLAGLKGADGRRKMPLFELLEDTVPIDFSEAHPGLPVTVCLNACSSLGAK